MRKRYLGLALAKGGVFLAAGILLGLQAEAVSFDCEEARSSAEKIICADSVLQILDSELAEAYRRVVWIEGGEKISRSQRAWLKSRDLCVDRNCIENRYQERKVELYVILHEYARRERIYRADTPLSRGDSSLERRPPFTTVDVSALDANWRFEHDSNKIPIIRDALINGGLTPDASNEKYLFCGSFPADLKAGLFEVIEPDYQALSVEDTWPDDELPPEKRGILPRNDLRERWSQCEGVDYSTSIASRPDDIYDGIIGRNASRVPPYRFYHAVLDTNADLQKFADIYTYRSDHSKYNHNYAHIDLRGCSGLGGASAISWGKESSKKYVNLSLAIRYRSKFMALIYSDSASVGERIPKLKIKLVDFSGTGSCVWSDPRI